MNRTTSIRIYSLLLALVWSALAVEIPDSVEMTSNLSIGAEFMFNIDGGVGAVLSRKVTS